MSTIPHQVDIVLFSNFLISLKNSTFPEFVWENDCLPPTLCTRVLVIEFRQNLCHLFRFNKKGLGI